MLKRRLLPRDGEHPPGHGSLICPSVSPGAEVVAGPWQDSARERRGGVKWERASLV